MPYSVTRTWTLTYASTVGAESIDQGWPGETEASGASGHAPGCICQVPTTPVRLSTGRTPMHVECKVHGNAGQAGPACGV